MVIMPHLECKYKLETSSDKHFLNMQINLSFKLADFQNHTS